LATNRSSRTSGLERVGAGSELRELGYRIATLDQAGITLDHLERGFLALAPEADVQLVLAETEVVDSEVGQPFRQRRVDKEPVARRIRQKA
jgi:hypothetical protein